MTQSFDIEACMEALQRFIDGKPRMSIPAQPNDDDLLIDKALDIAKAALEDYKVAENSCKYRRENDEHCGFYRNIKRRRHCDECPLLYFAEIEETLKGAGD